jgi:hypothetical protein
VRFLAHFWHANIPSGNPGWKWPDFHFCEMEESFCNCMQPYILTNSFSFMRRCWAGWPDWVNVLGHCFTLGSFY